jgi:class 3 adenylate cyclase
VHQEFRELLHIAEGQAKRVVVVFLDVREFSTFAGIAESTDTAEFLKSIYLRILDQYFPEASFFKPTGDGLLILSSYERDNLKQALTGAVATSIKLVEEFPRLCDDDPMINFEVPGKLGVGISRGSATCLEAGDKILDYSGRPLNLAARLMDLARPSGIVIDGKFGYDLLPKAVQERFTKDFAHIKGLAEEEPLDVFTLNGFTEIPEHNRSPINTYQRYAEPVEEMTFRDLEDRAPVYRHPLKKPPARKDTIKIHLSYPVVKPGGGKHPDLHEFPSPLVARYEQVGDKHFGVVNYSYVVQEMKEQGVKKPWRVTATVEYDTAKQ